MASDDSSFSVVLLRPSSASLEVAGLQPSDTVASLLGKVAELTCIPTSCLKLACGDKLISANVSSSLLASGLQPNSEVTVVRVVAPQIYCRGYEWRIDHEWDFAECESHERLLLDWDSSCFFVGLDRTQTEWSMDSHDVLQWDVLLGTYELQGEMAVCKWHRHLSRKISRSGLGSDRPADLGWEEKDTRASLKWQRIPLPDNPDDAEFRGRLMAAAAEADLAKADWFQQVAERRCREWPAASWGDRLQAEDQDTMYWRSIQFMSSEHGKVSPEAVQRMCLEEDSAVATAQAEAGDGGGDAWKSLVRPVRLGMAEWGDPPVAMDVAKAVGKWRKMDQDVVLGVLQRGLESFRGIDEGSCCLLGIPLLCPGGVELRGQRGNCSENADRGGTWVETMGVATPAAMLAELLALLQAAPAPCKESTAAFREAVGLRRYHFVADDGDRQLCDIDALDWRELEVGDEVTVITPFTTDNEDGYNAELRRGDHGTVMMKGDGWVQVEFPDKNPNWSDDADLYYIKRENMMANLRSSQGAEVAHAVLWHELDELARERDGA